MKPLKERYKNEITKALVKQFGYRNVLQVPKLVKVIVSRGVGEAAINPKSMDVAAEELSVICGQKPLITKAKKAIAGFKLKAGAPIGCVITLRGSRMYEFVDKLINICLPKIRDFKGVEPKSFDGRGNYSLGIREQLIFPEIVYDKVDKVRGMNITFVTSAKSDAEARELLVQMGIPFRKN